LIFLFADKALLDLGKVFSTLALLGYVFNFSIVYSNYAIEALYQLKVFNQRIGDVIDKCREDGRQRAIDAQIVDSNQNESSGHLLMENVYS
jgi:ABC-type bacteriocin/lantibiotic exporter with double-glycine peptidase domain